MRCCERRGEALVDGITSADSFARYGRLGEGPNPLSLSMIRSTIESCLKVMDEEGHLFLDSANGRLMAVEPGPF